MPRAHSAGFLLLLAALAAACASPIGAKRVDARRVHRELTASALSTDHPSDFSLQLVDRLNLVRSWREAPDEALAALHAGLAPSGDVDRLFALAELSFLRGEAAGRREHALAAAVYAYALLFPADPRDALDPLDPRLQIARNLYNRGLTLGLESPDGEQVLVGPGHHALPFGELEVSSDPARAIWAGHRLERFVPAAELEVRGLRNRYRRPGLGAPLAAALGPLEGRRPPGAERIPARLKIPATAFLRIEGPRAGLASGRLSAALELHPLDGPREVVVDGQSVPLEFETTSWLAYTLEGAPIWDFELAGFRSGDYLPGGPETRLLTLRPSQPGRIPLVLVHGTASSPARWAELLNELANDPEVAPRYQVWLFIYNTGNPVAYSGGLLVQALRDLVAELDPEGLDPALRKMVVVGHSQGGLLTKLTAIDSGNRFWDRISKKQLAELELKEQTRLILQRSFFYQPLPFVRRVIFISTPHQGSYLTTFQPSRWISRLVRAPLAISNMVIDLTTQNPDDVALRDLGRLPTSLDNMTPGNPFLRLLSEIPVDPRISAHSIIPVKGDGPYEQGNDGVVKYESAHIEGVESEKVIRFSHSVQGQPEAIREVRRILLENATQP